MSRPVAFFEGNADLAALTYPQNANVAATIAVKGAGFERTRVRLFADPTVSGNVHEILVRSACADFEFRIVGAVAPTNPKTSLTTGFALAARLLDEVNDYVRREGSTAEPVRPTPRSRR